MERKPITAGPDLRGESRGIAQGLPGAGESFGFTTKNTDFSQKDVRNQALVHFTERKLWDFRQPPGAQKSQRLALYHGGEFCTAPRQNYLNNRVEIYSEVVGSRTAGFSHSRPAVM